MYGIEDRATLYIVSPEEKEIIIFVKINPKKKIPLTAKPKDHVESIKKNLIDNHGISVENLYFSNEKLENEIELQNYLITNNSMLIASPINESIKIGFHLTYNGIGKYFELHVNSLSKIKEIKQQISSYLQTT